MPTAYTTILKLALPVTGELDGTWGDIVNDNITEMIEEAIAGKASVSSWTGASATLTTADGTTSQSRCAILDCSGAPGANATVICPTATKVYVVNNQVTGGYTVTLKTSGGTGIAVPNGSCMLLYCDGTNVVAGVSYVATAGAANSVNGSAVTGTVAVANGGTGANTLTGILKGNGTSAFSAAVSGTDIKTVNGSSLLGSGNLSVVGTLVRSARTSNTILAAADQSTFVDVTTGGFTQTFTAAATLGSGWWCVYRNNSTTDVTLDPSENIDGLSSFVMYPGEARMVQTDGSNFYTVLLAGFTKTFTSSGTFTKPPGYADFGVFVQGPGGGGGSGRKTSTGVASAGGGGGAGAWVRDVVPAAAVSSTETVTVGTGGAGGAGQTSNDTNGNNGSNGSGPSSFGTLLSAAAGSRGDAGSTVGGGGGAGGTCAGAIAVAGTAGGAASASWANTGTAATTTQGATGGGGGGGYDGGAAYASAAGGASGTSSSASQLAGGTAGATGATGTAGATGNSSNMLRGGTGGGGGGYGSSGSGGAGGAGVRGGGGGGGGACSNTGTSGAGGAGGDGVVVVWGIV